MAEYGRIRVLADRLGVEAIDREKRTVAVRFRPTARVDPQRLVKLVQEWPGAMLVPPVSLKLDLDAAGELPLRDRPDPEASWWTARATAGTVAAGFTKDEILRRPGSDSRDQGGIFHRLEKLLRILS